MTFSGCRLLNLYVHGVGKKSSTREKERIYKKTRTCIVNETNENIADLSPFFCFFPVRRVVVKLNVPYVIRWHKTKIPKKKKILSHCLALCFLSFLCVFIFWDQQHELKRKVYILSKIKFLYSIFNLNNRVCITFTNYHMKSRSLYRRKSK